MRNPELQLTHPAHHENGEKSETWLFTYESNREKRFGYMTLNFSNIHSGCEISTKGADGLPLNDLDIDQSAIDVRVSDFETLRLAEYIELTTSIYEQELEDTINYRDEEAFCLPMPSLSKLAKSFLGLRN